VYAKILQVLDGTQDMEKELSLFNKVGDLYLKNGNVQSAVETYERAANYYAEWGLHNNAIALCNKILRNAPGRTPVYLKLAKLMVHRGFVAEAKQNLLEYASRMQQAGQLEDAFNALKEFADLSPHNEDIRLLLAEQLKAAARTDEAKEQLAKLYHELEARGDQRRSLAALEKIQAIDPEFDADASPKPEVKQRARAGDLVFLDLSEEGTEAPAAVAEPEVRAPPPAPPPAPAVEEPAPVEEALEIEPTSLEVEAPPDAAAEVEEPVELERGSADYLAVADEVGDVDQLAELDVPEAEVGEVETVAGLDVMNEFEAPVEEAATSLDIEPTAVADAETAAEEVTAVEGLAETEARTSEGFVPPDAMIVPPAEEIEVPEVPEVPKVEEAERVSEGFVPPDAIIEPPAAAPVEAAPEAPPKAEPEFPEVSPPSTPVPLTAETAPPSTGMDVPDIDLGVGLDDAGAAPGDVAQTPLPGLPDVGAAGVEVEPPRTLELGTQAPVAFERPTVAELEEQVADNPDDASLHQALGEALLEEGDRERGIDELDIALEIHESGEEWHHAEALAEEILRLDPNSVRHHQKLVEFAFRRGDKDRLADAYLGLADGLFRTGATERARAVYQRVLEHDPDSERARLGLQTLEPVVEEAPAEPAAPAAEAAAEPPAAVPAPAAGDFVDLGSLLLDQEPVVRDTRMRIEEEEPTGDEQRDFEEMLSQFKKGIEANVAEEDWQAHYDLGVAFKEMGLLDEAISEFQKALRSEEGRLRAAEALGHCFFEKGQFSVAATVLRRAVDTGAGSDEGKIGLLYSLGRCEEEQGRTGEALTYYQRVFAIDINFQDVSDRVKGLAGAGG
jgi:tetratricopeptide (TPR) repeat protein